MTIGLRYRKLDLHVHTPASPDFLDNSVTPEDIVSRALDLSLDGIAVTDHNTGAWIDCIKEAASNTELVVFPGVEVHCNDGKRGIHMIALFDTDKDSEHVSGLLSRLGISPERQGDINELTDDIGLTAIVDIIQDRKWQGIAIPAHVSSDKGILSDLAGQKRIQVIHHRNLIAVEDKWDQYTEDGDRKRNAIDFLDGTDPNYQRKLAVYQASDNPSGSSKGGHGLDGIGSRFTYFKMESIDLESLRQCFLDPDVRILQQFEFEKIEFPRISGISVKGGFFDGESAAFNEGLNSILGGKGTGKSLLIELMRFALNQSPDREEIKRDHDNKLKHRLGELGLVEIDYVDENGNGFNLRRTLDPVSKGFNEIGYDPSQVFPVLFLSQNEIIRIAEDESLQLHFIDRFFPSRIYEERINALEAELHQLDLQLADGFQSAETVAQLTESIATVEMKLNQLNEKLDAPIFRKYAAARAKHEVIQGQYECISALYSLADEFSSDLSSIDIPELETAHAEDGMLKSNRDRLARVQERVTSLAKEMIQVLEEERTEFNVVKSQWDASFERIRQNHMEHVREEGKDHAALTSEHEQLQQRMTRQKIELKNAQQQILRIPDIAGDRTAKLD